MINISGSSTQRLHESSSILTNTQKHTNTQTPKSTFSTTTHTASPQVSQQVKSSHIHIYIRLFLCYTYITYICIESTTSCTLSSLSFDSLYLPFMMVLRTHHHHHHNAVIVVVVSVFLSWTISFTHGLSNNPQQQQLKIAFVTGNKMKVCFMCVVVFEKTCPQVIISQI